MRVLRAAWLAVLLTLAGSTSLLAQTAYPTHIVLEARASGTSTPLATVRDTLTGHCDVDFGAVTAPAVVVDDPLLSGRVCWWPLMPLPDGAYTLSALYEGTCSDVACFSSRTVASFTIGGTEPPPPPPPPPPSGNTAPTLTITSPISGAIFDLGVAVPLTASVVDVEDGDLSYRTTWTENGVSLGGGTSIAPVFAVAGSRTIVATVNDNHGVVVTASVLITVVGTAPPPPPTPTVCTYLGKTYPRDGRMYLFSTNKGTLDRDRTALLAGGFTVESVTSSQRTIIASCR
jgi:hypothetical protein